MDTFIQETNMNRGRLHRLFVPIVALGFVLGPTSCVSNNISIEILSVSAPKAPECFCEFNDKVFQARGTVDLSNKSGKPQFCWVGQLNVLNNLTNSKFQNGNDTVTDPARNDFQPNAIRVTYRCAAAQPNTKCTAAGVVFSDTELIPTSGFVHAGGQLGLCVSICSDNAAGQLSAVTDTVSLNVALQLEGRLTSGQILRSNEFQFPIRYSHKVQLDPDGGVISPANCTPPARTCVATSSCGSPGQDVYYYCSTSADGGC
jgi:hypothetical protein